MKHNMQIPTLTEKDISSIAVSDKKECLAVSLYLGIRADRDYLTVANSLFTEEWKRIKKNKRFCHNDREAVAAIFHDMGEKLKVIKLPDMTRTFVMFFDNLNGFRLYKVPVYIPSGIAVEKDLYVHPLIKNLQKYPRYGVVSLQRDRAKIYSYFWGEVVDETEEIRSDVPQRMNAARADWKGLSESRILKHIDVHVDWHLKKVADETDAYMREKKIPYLIIGSRRELFERFREHLPAGDHKKIVGSYLVRTDQNLKMIRKKSLEAIDKFELTKEDDIINRIIEGNSKRKKMAVLGIKLVLEKILKYEVYTLIIGKNYAPEGCLYSASYHMYPKKAGRQACAMPMMQLREMTDEVIEMAVANKIKIFHLLHDHPDFDEFGIGAILK